EAQAAQPVLPVLDLTSVPEGRIEQAATAVAGVFQAEIERLQPTAGTSPIAVAPLDFQATSTAVAGALIAEAEVPGTGIIGIVAQVSTPAVGSFQTEIAFQGQVDPVAVQMTSTAVADVFGTALAPGQGGGLTVGAVAQTATALASLLQQPTQADQVIVSPTPEGGTPSFRPTELPDTGLFDDIAAGNPAGLGAILLALAGLIAVIVISRRLRALNK
ncbi:MAG: hypothetical protein K8I30_20515, partial [Anaerolineae bacterium]|nr:hypothetical protein [Anaerolineae bacterium]